MKEYEHLDVEKKWQKEWSRKKAYKTQNLKGKKYYVLDMFPYPSGTGLHVGHPKGYIGSDVFARMKRMQGFNVLHPMGYDAFGLPAEQYALEHHIHPRKAVEENVKTFEKQLSVVGLSYDWERRVNTTDPGFYKWTQWIFLKLYDSWYNKDSDKAEPIATLIKKFEKSGNKNVKAVSDGSTNFSATEWKSKTKKEKEDILMRYRLAYEGYSEVNWCPVLGTVLANDEVVDSPNGPVSERGSFPVVKKEMRQWFLRITAYANRLLGGLQDIDWADSIKEIQRNWIGRSEGAEIDFSLITGEKPNFLILHGFTGHNNTNFIPWLRLELEKNGFDVQTPQLPHTDKPKEGEQVEYVIKNCRIDENTIIIGHSLGGVVAIKVLQKLNQKIQKLILVAPAIDPQFHHEGSRPFWKDFKWDYDYEQIRKLTEKIIILSDLKETKRAEYLKFLAEQLGAKLVEGYSEKEHFCALEEPLILESILPKIRIFTTRPDTIFGATYLVLSPEHPWVTIAMDSDHLGVIQNRAEVKEYILAVKNKTEEERISKEKGKTGVLLRGVKAVNPGTKEEIPVFIADYVLAQYGTGAIMAVPAHDERDFEFAKKYNLFIQKVVSVNFSDEKILRAVPYGRKSLQPKPLHLEYDFYEGEGYLINSGKFTGIPTEKAKGEIVKEVGGKTVTQYKMRDAVFARQRYWGEPIPLIHNKDGTIAMLSEKKLPLKLPEVKSYQPTGTGESPLSAVKSWAKQGFETNTMPGWAGSSWYFLRYMDPKNKKVFADKKAVRYWKNVDMYVGGAEHATGHLLYSRFWNKFLKDYGLVLTEEPFQRLRNQGLILGTDGRKMSKRWGNVVNPNDVVRDYGADTLRVYEMFMGPFDGSLPWSMDNIIGSRRFIDRVWRLYPKISRKAKLNIKLNVSIHKTIKKVTEDIESFAFNTAVSSMMILLNEMEKQDTLHKKEFELFLKILSPFAPHITEELWSLLGNKSFLVLEKWPKVDSKNVYESEIKITVQINGKMRAIHTASIGSNEEELILEIKQLPDISKWLINKEIKKVIYIKNKLVNFVVI